MAKKVTLVLGVVFLLVGVLGFVPNSIIGPGAMFDADTMHSIVHLVTGLVFLGVALAAADSSALVLKVFGVVYLLVAILGFLSSSGMVLGLINVNTADNWLHLVLGIVILGAAFMGGSKGGMTPPAGPMQ